MTNTNCLAGMACPQCHSPGPFAIEATSVFTFHDDGTGDHGDVTYDGESYCVCDQCEFESTVSGFQTGATS